MQNNVLFLECYILEQIPRRFFLLQNFKKQNFFFAINFIVQYQTSYNNINCSEGLLDSDTLRPIHTSFNGLVDNKLFSIIVLKLSFGQSFKEKEKSTSNLFKNMVLPG